MEKLESSIADDLLSIWLRATGRTAQNILDDPKYKNIPQTARSTIQRMIDFGELEFNFSLTRNLGENGRLNMIKRVISDGFKGRDSIIIFDGNGGTNYDVKTVTEYNAIVFRDITKFNKNIFSSIFSTPENLRKYYGTINTKNWSDLGLYFQSRQWSSRLLEGVNPVLYKTFFTELADKRKKQEQDRINPLFADIRGKFSGSPQVIRGMELFAKGVGIEFGPDGNVDIDKILSQIIGKGEKEGKSYSEALKHLTTELGDLRKKIEDISKSIKAERQELLRSLGGTDISLSRFSELSHVSMLIRGSDGKEKDLRHTAIVSLTKNEANSLLNSISNSLDNKNISPRIAQVIILLGLQARYGEIGQAKGSIHATQKELEKNPHLLGKNSEGRRVVTVDQKTKTKIHLAGTISEQAQVLQDTGKLVQEMQDNIGNLESAQIALKKLRDNGIKTQKEREKEARLVAYIEQYTAVAKTYTIVEREYRSDDQAKEFFQEYYEIGRDRLLSPGEKIDYKALKEIAVLSDPEIPKGEKSFIQLEIGQSVSMAKIFDGDLKVGIADAPELAAISIEKTASGNYNIPFFKANNLSKEEVDEYKKSIKIYAELGLSQFIPHIPRINEELRKQGINARVDGKMSTIEQQQILKAIYQKLYGEILITSNLSEVQWAFISKSRNYTNMKQAIQHVLIAHRLIPGSGQAIPSQNIVELFKENDPMTAICFT